MVYLPSTSDDAAAPDGRALDLNQKRAEATETEARQYLEGVARLLRQEGLQVEAVTMRGAPSEAIVRYAQDNGIDLIAMATHRRSGIGRLVFGSVADFVLRELGIPVLVVKPQEHCA